jgi:hypothetical protein
MQGLAEQDQQKALKTTVFLRLRTLQGIVPEEQRAQVEAQKGPERQ